ncbi:hypothetical protein V8C86DRAFT_2507085 [Haematococcus lacustris]
MPRSTITLVVLLAVFASSCKVAKADLTSPEWRQVATSGPIYQALLAATSPSAAGGLGSAATQALGVGADVAEVAGQLGAAAKGGAAVAYGALRSGVAQSEQLIADILDIRTQIESELRSQARDVAMAAAFAPLKQADAAFNALSGLRSSQVGPKVVDHLQSAVGLLSSPTAGLPALLQSAVSSAGMFFSNPAAARVALVDAVRSTTASIGDNLSGVMKSAGTLLNDRLKTSGNAILGFVDKLGTGFTGFRNVIENGVLSKLTGAGLLGNRATAGIRAIVTGWLSPLDGLKPLGSGLFSFGLLRDSLRSTASKTSVAAASGP